MSYIEGLPPLPKCFSGVMGPEVEKLRNVVEEDEEQLEQVVEVYNGEHDSSDNQDDCSVMRENHDDNYNSCEDDNSPFTKLNVALRRLKDEMAGLRQLDLCLLRQLWSLNDAIQEYKTAVNDRYSETNSEYSYGMSSRTSSIGSIDEYGDDWADFYVKADSKFDTGSTSSLLQQINELKERAVSDF